MNYDSIDILSDEQVLSIYDDTVGYPKDYTSGYWATTCQNGLSNYTRSYGYCYSIGNFGCGRQYSRPGAVINVCGYGEYGCHYCASSYEDAIQNAVYQ